MATIAASLLSGSLKSGLPRPVKTRSSWENRLQTTRPTCKVGCVNASEKVKQVCSCPLGDITNLKTKTLSGKLPIGIPRPCKRPNGSDEVSPSKLRALPGRRAVPIAEEFKAPEDEYVPNIMDRLFDEEPSATPGAMFFQQQKDINTRMRAILVDWLVDVHRGFRISPESLFLAVNLLDRYLSKVSVPRTQLQLVGVVALFVASKFEDVNPPPVGRLAYMTAGAFSTEDLLTFECVFLAKLNFKVLVPTPVQFLGHAVREAQVGKEGAELAFYALELALLDDRCSCYEPSSLAAAALLVSGEALEVPQLWSEVAAASLRRKLDDLAAPAKLLKAHLVAAKTTPLAAIRKKYSAKERCAVALKSIALV